ncbi:DEAD/DEAH box helicase family protein [Bacillaceae bacterium SIJ1]|uniref:DEAD/DEAH box helicase n=1 Tax=Litoribacterium kuwaitense TaxID=1398745 RepID=UPI0013EB5EAF|nr:SNF2-related protein [Litoribacterium kuwaitense]NGP43583.1 DEAD/DEAH box helicase family protein [Litoribacterium kuwaitense]
MTDIQFDSSFNDQFMKRYEADGHWDDWTLYQLHYEVEKKKRIQSFDQLLAPDHLPELEIFKHQRETAERVIQQMNGKAILADEVGLGKTIEAGLILKEYMIRGLVQKVLILAPASLVSQWEQELNTKFFIPAVSHRKTYVWEQCDVVISSLDTAKREPHRSIIYEQNYDMVIIDEAHRLKNHKTKNYEFVRHLKKKFCLLLTATPVQNKIDEVFHLVSLLKPGHLGPIEKRGKLGKSTKEQHDLKELIGRVMVRNRRQDTGLEWPDRVVHTENIDMSEEEHAIYQEISRLPETLERFRKHPFLLITLQREFCSSREAFFQTISQYAQDQTLTSGEVDVLQPLLNRMQELKIHAKAEHLLKLLQQTKEKAVVFTEYRATQVYLQWLCQQHGIRSVPFRGGFKRSKKDWMQQLFRDHADVLIATEAGGEGINLQFCHHVFNYDLPWNPMRVEQRIGRLHRLGQENDVHIYNLALRDTIETHIVSMLYEKIHLFENVIGRLDDILERVQMTEVDEYIEDIFTHSESTGEQKIKIDHLTSVLKNLGEEKAQ